MDAALVMSLCQDQDWGVPTLLTMGMTNGILTKGLQDHYKKLQATDTRVCADQLYFLTSHIAHTCNLVKSLHRRLKY